MGASAWVPRDDEGCFYTNTSHRHNLAFGHQSIRLYSVQCIVLEPSSYVILFLEAVFYSRSLGACPVTTGEIDVRTPTAAQQQQQKYDSKKIRQQNQLDNKTRSQEVAPAREGGA